MIEVGLSPNAWAQAPALGKRVLLAELGARALLELSSREGWHWPKSALAAATEMFK
jgi:hypothetical protein